MKYIIPILLFSLLLSGCKIDDEIIQTAKQAPLKLTRHNQKFYDITIPPELQSKIFEWLEANQTNWKDESFITFVPTTVLDNKMIRINIMNSIMVISTKENSKGWKQYSRSLEAGNLLWIIELEKLIEPEHGAYRDNAR